MRRWLLLSLLLARTAHAQDSGVPWTERPSCAAAVDRAMLVDFAGAEVKLRALEASRDLDDTACALWTRASMVEFQLGILGKSAELEATRKRALGRLMGFARANKAQGLRFADLELEARLRRIRVLSDEGQRTASLGELRELAQLLEARGEKDPTPSLHYTLGVMNAALASPGWAARAALSVLGVSVDAAVGAKHLHVLIDGKTVYRGDALYLTQFFSSALGSPPFRAQATYRDALFASWPESPQFAYEALLARRGDGKCGEARSLIQKPLARVDAEPAAWGPLIRARLFWLGGSCALDAGDKAEARRLGIKARAEKVLDYRDRINELVDSAAE